jgi:hypothetical protein
MPALREIEDRELTERCFRGSVVSLCCFLFDVVSGMEYFLASELQLGFPFVFALTPRDAAISASVPKICAIHSALTGIGYAQIGDAIIQRISVYMVSVFAIALRQAKNLTMHVGALVSSILHERTSGVKCTIRTFPCVPFPSAKFGLRGLVDDCEFALSKFDNELSMFHRYTQFQGITSQERTLCLNL